MPTITLRRAALTAIGCSMLLAGTAFAQTQTPPQSPPMGPGMMRGPGGTGYGTMGPGMMGRNGMGPGMMWGQGMMGQYGCPYCGFMWGKKGTNANLSAADVKTNLEQWLARNGNPRLKVGSVVETNADTITADVVTAQEGALVERYQVNRHTGFFQPAP